METPPVFCERAIVNFVLWAPALKPKNVLDFFLQLICVIKTKLELTFIVLFVYLFIPFQGCDVEFFVCFFVFFFCQKILSRVRFWENWNFKVMDFFRVILHKTAIGANSCRIWFVITGQHDNPDASLQEPVICFPVIQIDMYRTLIFYKYHTC